MPDFHDPATREQMEREGWIVVETTQKFRCTKERMTIYIFQKPTAALKAASAILEGVEG